MRQLGRDLEKRMGGYGVGPMPKKNDDDIAPVRAVQDDGDADPDEATASAADSPPRKNALGRAALNKS